MKNKLFYVLVFATVFVVSYWILHAGGGAPYDDGKFYIALSKLQAQGNFIKDYPWIYYSDYRLAGPGLHFFYILLLTPFVWFFSLAQASVVAASVFFAATALVFLKLLEYLKVHAIWWWGLLFVAGSADFLFRNLLTRPISLSLLILLGLTYSLFSKKYYLLFFLAFIYVWLYDGFVLMWLPVVAWGIVQLVRDRTVNWQAVLCTGAGMIAGLVINPFFPDNVLFRHFLLTPPTLAEGVQNSVEWAPYQLWDFVQSNWAILLVYVAAIWQWAKHYQPKSLSSLFLISLALFVMMLVNQRFVEYWAPFAILFSALQLESVFSKIKFQSIRKLFVKFWQFQVACFFVIICLVGGIYYNLNTVQSYYHELPAADTYRGAGEWLVINSNSGEIVFNTQWDQFTGLFYWNQKNYYIVGLDPTFLFDYDQELYREWLMISQDREDQWGDAKNLHTIITQKFKADYVIIQHQKNPQLEHALESPAASAHFRKVYEDNAVSLFEIF